MTDSRLAVRVAPSPIEGTGVIATREFAARKVVLALDTSREVTDAAHPYGED